MSLMLADSSEVVAVLAISGGLAVAIVAIIAGTMKANRREREREQSRREIAAYVAEGSMSAADAERLIAAGRKRKATDEA
ncbi:MAG: hypothetical protein JNK35_05555 [Phycisphaerae bacterium]|nr:hypothetical protein [Phycisphaerae bacterium]